MFDNKEDFSFLTGGLGDLNGDGIVDLVELAIEEETFETIMGAKKDDDDDNSLFDDEDDFDSDNDDFDNDFDGDNDDFDVFDDDF